MSEFSQSYHLRTSDKEEAISLLNRSGKHGYVFESTNGWVTFVIADGNFSVDEEVTEQNTGTLVHYVYAEDHGWELLVYNKNKLVFDYNCAWEDNLVIKASKLDLIVIQNLKTEQGKPVDNIESIFDVEDIEELFALETPPAYLIADHLGIVHYDWLSYDSVHDDPSFFQGITEI
ncbi:hypothetical protein BK120_22935 [Paenibacillus sp. FSL A5-0031]|uniref:hypothetical protein n=1 Tax=Paenibacillus sp. FSL A5-0031 TaxID=1920420 RepID=UPI00096F6A42|nr:hypothetical protein [Paenibacillus sp. FSL A5-0031]OME78597.1 hypothetical protein BK120_22935 [Paenibacillus sp. FSL A5-0031]